MLKNLKQLEKLNEQFRLAVLMRATNMPFKSEYVPVEEMEKFLLMGYVFATHESVQMVHPDSLWPAVCVPKELAERYLEMGYQPCPTK